MFVSAPLLPTLNLKFPVEEAIAVEVLSTKPFEAFLFAAAS
jgi:hypothetical protein